MLNLDLQFFGGRGASSGGGGGATIPKSGYTITSENGQTIEWYFRKEGNNTYYSNTINGIPKPTPNNLTEKEMIERVKANGGVVNKKSKAQLKSEQKEYERQRKETDDILNQAFLRDKDFVRGSRSNRIRSRASRRNI